MDCANLILSIVGILVSGIGLYYAIKQVKGLKEITIAYQKQVEKEVSTAQEKIREGLLISEITACVKNTENAIKYIQDGEIQLALLRMEDIELTLHDNSICERYLDKFQQTKFRDAVDRYTESLRSMMKNVNDRDMLNIDYIIESLSIIREYMSIIDSKIKSSLYGKRD